MERVRSPRAPSQTTAVCLECAHNATRVPPSPPYPRSSSTSLATTTSGSRSTTRSSLPSGRGTTSTRALTTVVGRGDGRGKDGASRVRLAPAPSSAVAAACVGPTEDTARLSSGVGTRCQCGTAPPPVLFAWGMSAPLPASQLHCHREPTVRPPPTHRPCRRRYLKELKPRVPTDAARDFPEARERLKGRSW